MRLGHWVVVVCGLIPLAFLAGCGGFTGDVAQQGGTQATGGVAGAKLAGRVYGGQQPIVGAHVYLFAANTTGYGGNGIAASSSNASVSLLTSTAGTALDTSGGATNGDYYVATSGVTVSCPNGGCFTITGDYTCAAGAQVYLYARGGDAGGGTNAAAGLMAALGNCPMAGNFAAATPYIVVNEVSTVAAAYAMAGFATDATHVSSSGTALAQVGIANAFANAGNLETLATGVALATTPAVWIAPQATVNTLANILAACVNSTGAVTGPTNPTACYTLFNNAESGGSSGAVPTDTATAAINLAHNPGVNVASLYGLASATPPFAPALSAQPNDFTLGLQFTYSFAYENPPWVVAIDGSGNAWIGYYGAKSVSEMSSSGLLLSFGYSGGGLDDPYGIAIDDSGDAWVTDNVFTYPGGVTVVSGTGAILSGTGGYYGGGLSLPQEIAIDGSGNAWTTNQLFPTGSIVEISNSGSFLSGANGYSGSGQIDAPGDIAIDGSGNAWWTNGAGGPGNVGSVAKLSGSGSFPSGVSIYAGSGIDLPGSIAIDASGNAWVTTSVGVTKMSNSGSVLSGANGYTGGGTNGGGGVTIDGSGNVWIGNASGGDIGELSNSGTPLSPSTGYTGGLLEANNVRGIALDGSGNVWVLTSEGLSEFIGVATPVIRPIAAGLPATPTADGSSNLGTRP